MKHARLILVIVVAVALAACGSSGASPSAPDASTAVATPTPAPASPAPTDGSRPGQTDTEWGRIWDSLPPGFPHYPGGTPDESAGGGPASAVIVVDGLDPEESATFLRTLLLRAGYTEVGSLDPLEDGSVVLEMTGSQPDCRLQATATQTGGVTTVRILYGAGCPWG